MKKDFKDLKVGVKLKILSRVFIGVLLFITVLTVAMMTLMHSSNVVIAENWLPSVEVSGRLNRLISDMRVKEYKYILSNEVDSRTDIEQEIKQIENNIKELLNKYKALILDDTEKQYFQSIEDKWNNYLEYNEQLFVQIRNNHESEAMNLMTHEMVTLFDELSVDLERLEDFNSEGADRAAGYSRNIFISAIVVTLGIEVLVFIVLFNVSNKIKNSILDPVHELETAAQKIARGELDFVIGYQSEDELGSLASHFNKTILSLREYINEIASVVDRIASRDLVYDLTYEYEGNFSKIKDSLVKIGESLNETFFEIKESVSQVKEGAEQVAKTSEVIAEGATEQTQGIQELTHSISKISEKVQSSTRDAENTNEIVSKLGVQIEESNKKMDEMLLSMNEIEESSRSIREVISTIEGIAEQTNLLALNAAIEAARAGEVGKGFAVVADQVRKLAEESSKAVKDTTELIGNSIHAVEKGKVIADTTAMSLKEVVQHTKEAVDLVDNITKLSEEQAVAIKQIHSGIDQISDIVQSNSAISQESSAASEELSAQADTLETMIKRFKLK